MIQCRLRELMAAKTRLTRRKITYSVIKEETGLSKTTLVRLGNDRADLIGTARWTVSVPSSTANLATS